MATRGVSVGIVLGICSAFCFFGNDSAHACVSPPELMNNSSENKFLDQVAIHCDRGLKVIIDLSDPNPSRSIDGITVKTLQVDGKDEPLPMCDADYQPQPLRARVYFDLLNELVNPVSIYYTIRLTHAKTGEVFGEYSGSDQIGSMQWYNGSASVPLQREAWSELPNELNVSMVLTTSRGLATYILQGLPYVVRRTTDEPFYTYGANSSGNRMVVLPCARVITPEPGADPEPTVKLRPVVNVVKPQPLLKPVMKRQSVIKRQPLVELKPVMKRQSVIKRLKPVIKPQLVLPSVKVPSISPLSR